MCLQKLAEAEALRDSIAFGERDMSSYTDDELLLAFSDTAGDYPTDEIREHILPQVYGCEYEYIMFNGQNCDDCPGCSGFSRRCACGNRRVSWACDHGHYYMEAY